MSQIKKGALLSYFTIFLSNVIGLLLTPFVIRNLGNSEYGLYQLIGAFVGYISIIDFGLNNSVVRFVSKYRAENDKKSEENFLAIIMCIYGVIALVILVIGIILYINLDNIFSNSLTNTEISKAKIMFIVLVFNLVVTIPGGSFTAICSGYEQFVFPKTINIARYIFRSISVVGLLVLGGDAIGLVVIDTIMNLLVILFIATYTFKKLKVTFKIHSFNIPLIKDIFSFSVWVFVYAIVHQFQWNAGQFVIGVNTNTVTVAIFAVGIMLGGYYAAFGGVINSVLIPKANQMVVANLGESNLTEKMIKYGRLNAYIMSLVLSSFILFGREFILLWVGDTYNLSYRVAIIMMVALSLLLIQGFGNSILEAKKKNRFKSILSLTTISLAIIIGFFLSKSYGIMGVIIPLGIAIFLNSLIMNIYYKIVFSFKPIMFFKNALLKLFLFHTALTLLFFYFKSFFIVDSWIVLALCIVSYFVFYVFITYFFLMNSSEKDMLKANFK